MAFFNQTLPRSVFLAVLVCTLQTHASGGDADLNDSRQIALSEGLAERSGDLLSVRAKSGAVVEFRDEHGCGENGAPFDSAHCVRYAYMGHQQARHGHLVLATAYEDSSFIWISDLTGGKTVLHGEPNFSPDGRLFVAVRPSELGWNGIQAGKWDREGLSIQWEFQPKTYALYDFSSWVDNQKVALRVTQWKDGALVALPETLDWTKNRWQLKGAEATVEAP